MYAILFHRLGVLAMRSEKPGTSLYVISFWRLFVVAFSPRGRWIDVVWCERHLSGSKYHLETKE